MCFNERVHRCDIGLRINAIDEVIKCFFISFIVSFSSFFFICFCRFSFDKCLIISCMPIIEIRFHGNSVKPLMFSYYTKWRLNTKDRVSMHTRNNYLWIHPFVVVSYFSFRYQISDMKCYWNDMKNDGLHHSKWYLHFYIYRLQTNEKFIDLFEWHKWAQTEPNRKKKYLQLY